MFKIALRNVFRQRRRSLLTALTMLGGFVLAAFSIAWGDGTYNDVIHAFTHNRMGDIQIHASGYGDNPSLHRTFHAGEDIGRIVSAIPHVEAWAPRVYAGALVSVAARTCVAQIAGIDPSREGAATSFDRKIREGRPFSTEGRKEVVMGRGLARLLRAGIGSEAVVISQAADGSVANDLFRVVGISESGDDVRDRTDFYLRLTDAQELLVLEGRLHEIAVTVDRGSQADGTVDRLATALDGRELEVIPWQEFAADFYRAMKADLQGMWIMLFIILLIVAVGVLNTVLMSVLERQREYGVMLALGTRPAEIFRMVQYEAAVLALASVALGSLIALGINYALSIHGMTLPEPYSYGGMTFDRFRTEINARSFLIPAATVLLTTLLVAILPALRACRTDPARSMRMT